MPNRVLTLWPYTDISSSHVSRVNRFILVRAESQPPFKIGFPNSRGWLGYWLDGTLFVKRVPFESQSEYCDLGSSSECYCNHRFLELETLGPIGILAPGASSVRTEVWELYGNVKPPEDEDSAQTILDEIGLE